MSKPVHSLAAASIVLLIGLMVFATDVLAQSAWKQHDMKWYFNPGVLIGGQIGPRLQGKISQTTMEHAIGWLFVVLAIAMMSVALRKLGII